MLAFAGELIRQWDRHPALRDKWRAPFWAGIHCLSLFPPVLLMLAWRSGGHVGGQTGDWFNWRAKVMWVTMILRDRWELFDLASLAVLFLVLLKGFRDPNIQYSRHLSISALFLLAVYLLLPRIVFGSAYADMRLAPFAIAVALIAIRPRPNVSARALATFALLGLSFYAVRLAGTTVSFALYDRSYDRALTALDKLPQHARVVSFVGRRCQDDWGYSRLEHLPAMLIVRRLAFSNDQWSMAGAQQLTTRYPAAKGFAHDPSQIVTDKKCRGEWWRPIKRAQARFPRDAFDYVWLLNPPPHDARLLQGLTPIWRDGDDVLYRVDDRRQPAEPDPEQPPQFSKP